MAKKFISFVECLLFRVIILLFSKLKALLYIEEVAATLELAQYSLEQVSLCTYQKYVL